MSRRLKRLDVNAIWKGDAKSLMYFWRSHQISEVGLNLCENTLKLRYDSRQDERMRNKKQLKDSKSKRADLI